LTSLIGTRLEHYLIKSQIGQGGMATVYRAVDERSGAQVAVKILSPTISGDRRFIKRFRREAQLVTQLKHPNIVPVLAYGESEGFVFTVMPFIEGETLFGRMTRAPVSFEECARWIGQVSSALHYAHQQGRPGAADRLRSGAGDRGAQQPDRFDADGHASVCLAGARPG
jgi:serine/threonine protein kinase